MVLCCFLRAVVPTTNCASRTSLYFLSQHDRFQAFTPSIFEGKIGQIPSFLKSGMLISHLCASHLCLSPGEYLQTTLTWSFLCPLICPHISLKFIPVTHLFSRSHSFDSPACIVHFAKLTAEKIDCIYGPVFRPHAHRPHAILDCVWEV